MTAVGRGRARGRRAGRIARAAHPREGHPRRLGRARPRHRASRTSRRRSSGQIAELRAAARRGDRRRRACGRGPSGDEYYRWALKASTTTTMTPGRNPPDGPRRAARASGADGPDPQEPRLHPGLGRRRGCRRWARTRATNSPKATRAAPRSWPSSRSGCSIIRAKLPQRFNTLVRGNLEVRRLPPEEEPGAPGAYGGAGSIDGTIPGKFWINLRTTDLHTQVQPARPHPSRGDPGPCLAGRICQQAAADPHPAGVQRLFRRLGALCRAARRRARRL